MSGNASTTHGVVVKHAFVPKREDDLSASPAHVNEYISCYEGEEIVLVTYFDTPAHAVGSTVSVKLID
jgi:hypothetical protein